jgi:hypothetical protein
MLVGFWGNLKEIVADYYETVGLLNFEDTYLKVANL